MKPDNFCVPSVDFWTYEEFLTARWRQAKATREQPLNIPEGFEHIVIDGGDEIICDLCGDEVPNDGQLINLVDFGSRVVCDKCYQKHYASEPVRHRRLTKDGRLGAYIPIEKVELDSAEIYVPRGKDDDN